MKSVGLVLALTLIAGARLDPGDNAVRLVQEDRTTLHVGDRAFLQAPADARYARFRPAETTPGQTLTFVRRSGLTVWYRAARPGQDVIVISPDTAPGACISCATIHYFISVLAR